MVAKLEIYKCGVCGNMVEVIFVGGGTLVCCNEEMKLLKENSTDAAKEKHVPVIEKSGAGITVRVGSVPHPMEQKHHIEWIQLIADGKAYREFLKPGSEPSATFPIQAKEVKAREYCNLHGLWKG